MKDFIIGSIVVALSFFVGYGVDNHQIPTQTLSPSNTARSCPTSVPENFAPSEFREGIEEGHHTDLDKLYAGGNMVDGD